MEQAQNFKKQQADIDRRLLIVTQSETSDDAVQKFDTVMGRLQRLDVATGYMNLLAEVDSLELVARKGLKKCRVVDQSYRRQARKNFKASPQEALEPYLHLQRIVVALKEAQPAAEDAAPHLVDHVERTVRTLWQQMKDAFASGFEETLSRMYWPGKDLNLTTDMEKEWNRGVERLLDLQEPYVLILFSFSIDWCSVHILVLIG